MADIKALEAARNKVSLARARVTAAEAELDQLLGRMTITDTKSPAQADAKAKARKSPKEHAREFPLGYVRKGEDGNLWIRNEDKNGRAMWSVKTENTEKSVAAKTAKLMTVQ